MNAYALRVLDRTLRTAAQAFLGYLIAAHTIGGVDWRTAWLAIALTVAVSVVQGLVDLPAIGGLGVWGDIIGRAVRTFGQTAAGSLVGVVLVTDVSWQTVLSASALAALTSVVTSLIAMPIGPAAVKGTPEIVGAEHPTRPVAA